MITDNFITNNQYGIYCETGSPIVKGNLITNNKYGIYSTDSSPLISDNTITVNNIWGIYVDSVNFSVNVSIKRNMISTNGNGIIRNSIYGVPVKVTITENTIKGNTGIGFQTDGGGDAHYSIIARNIISENGGTGVFLGGWSLSEVSDNIITSNAGNGIAGYSATISGNTIKNNAAYGIFDGGFNTDSPTTIHHNEITNNGGIDYQDIHIESVATTKNVSFNIYDSISGSNGVARFNFNVKSDGTPAPTL